VINRGVGYHRQIWIIRQITVATTRRKGTMVV
jgi:hypothetical protein